MRFSEDEIIMQNLVHLKEEPDMGGGYTAGSSAAGGMGNALRRRRRHRTEVGRRIGEDDDCNSGGLPGVRADGVGEEDGDPPDAREGRPITTTATAAASHTAAGQRYAQTTEFRYLGGLVNEHGDLTREINYRSKIAWVCFKRYARELFDRPGAPFHLKTRLLKAEAMEALLYGCVTWSPRREHYRLLLQTTHHRLLLRVMSDTGASREHIGSCHTRRR